MHVYVYIYVNPRSFGIRLDFLKSAEDKFTKCENNKIMPISSSHILFRASHADID